MAEQRRPPNPPRPTGPQRPAPTPPAATVPALVTNAGTFSDLALANQELGRLGNRAHVLAPVLRLDMVPEFHEVALKVCTISPDPNRGEVYPQEGGKLAPTKVALDRIAAAAGIHWDPLRSGRLDDGSERHYCHFRAVGRVKDLDGGWRILSAEKEVDLRDGNPTIFDPENTHGGQNVEPGFRRGWSSRRLAGAREHILALAESKAKNRVVRSLGMKQTYTAAELAMPFVVPCLVFTGRSDDPELERVAKLEILKAGVAAAQELFGASIDVTPQRPFARHAPPQIAAEPVDDEEIEPAAEPQGPAPEQGSFFSECGCPDGPGGKHEPGCIAARDPGQEG